MGCLLARLERDLFHAVLPIRADAHHMLVLFETVVDYAPIVAIEWLEHDRSPSFADAVGCFLHIFQQYVVQLLSVTLNINDDPPHLILFKVREPVDQKL